MNKSLRTAIALALSMSLALNGVAAEARPTQSSGSYKGGFSSQKSSPARSGSSAAPARSGNSSFGSFGSARRAPDAASSRNQSAMSQDLSKNSAQDNAQRTLDSRRAANNALPPLDPVQPRQAPQYGQQPSQYGQPSPQYGNPGYSDRNGRLATAGAAAAGAVLGSILSSPARAGGGTVQQAPAPSNVPSDIGSLGPVAPATDVSSDTSAATATVAPVAKPSSGIGFFGWVIILGLAYAGWRLFSRRKPKANARYNLGD
jgi:hypothetical protein